MQATARMASVVSSPFPARRRLIRSVRPTSTPLAMPTSIFVSRPTKLTKEFDAAYKPFHSYLQSKHKLRLRRLGDTDHSPEPPLRAIIDLMSECRGAIILGYPQVEIYQHVRKSIEIRQDPTMLFPTPWNQIEGALAYGTKLPVLVIAHAGIGGGIFDHGVTGEFVLTLDLTDKKWFMHVPFQQLLAKWSKKMTTHKKS
jgi:hypothetical protein